MIRIENVVTPSGEQWMAVIRGMRNPLNSWKLSDSYFYDLVSGDYIDISGNTGPSQAIDDALDLGEKDLKLMTNLRNAGAEHRKYLRKVPVYLDIVAPLYWWKEFDTYKVGTVANSCSTMHKIQAKEFTLDDFSCEHLMTDDIYCHPLGRGWRGVSSIDALKAIIELLNNSRHLYLKTKDKKYWWQLIQLLPSSYNQRRTVMLNYEVLANMYHQRRHHKLDEWHTFCDWIESLPYAELITGKKKE